MTVLDWRDHPTGPPKPCHLCHKGKTILRDEHGRPCHKVCAEDIPAALAASPEVAP